jgi:pilus assembly protein CpaB
LLQNRFAVIEALMRKRPLVVSACAGLAAMLLVGMYLNYRETKLLHISDPLPIIVAAVDLDEGERLAPASIEVRDIPRRFVQPGAFTSASAALRMVAAVPIKAGSQITTATVLDPGPKTGVGVALTDGMRAVSVAVDEVHGVAGLIRPGDHVDVLVTFDFGDEAISRKSTITILQDVMVLAVGDRVADEAPLHQEKNKGGMFGDLNPRALMSSRVKAVTVALPPDDVQRMVYAQEAGTVTLSVRPSWENETRDLAPATIETVTGKSGLLRQHRPAYREYRGK